MENRVSIDPYLLKTEDLRPFVNADISIDKVVNRQKIKRAFGLALVGFALHFGGGAPLAVSAQGPETPTPTPTSTAGNEGLCIIDGDVWRGTVRMDGVQNSGEPDVVGMQVELTGSNGIEKEDTTRSNGRYYFSGLPRNGVYSLNFGGIVQKVVNLAKEAHGKAVCFKKEHVEIPPGSPTPTNTPTATEVPTNTATATNTPTATETITATETETITPTKPNTPTKTITVTPTGETVTTTVTPTGTIVTRTVTPTEVQSPTPTITKTSNPGPTPELPPVTGAERSGDNKWVIPTILEIAGITSLAEGLRRRRAAITEESAQAAEPRIERNKDAEVESSLTAKLVEKIKGLGSQVERSTDTNRYRFIRTDGDETIIDDRKGIVDGFVGREGIKEAVSEAFAELERLSGEGKIGEADLAAARLLLSTINLRVGAAEYKEERDKWGYIAKRSGINLGRSRAELRQAEELCKEFPVRYLQARDDLLKYGLVDELGLEYNVDAVNSAEERLRIYREGVNGNAKVREWLRESKKSRRGRALI